MFEIIVRDNRGQEVNHLRCTEGRCTIGRSGKNLVHLNGWRIAGTHAELIEKNGGVFITDLSAGMGTLVNGKNITTYGPLMPGDEIVISSFRIEVTGDPVHGVSKPAPPDEEQTAESGTAADDTVSAGPLPVDKTAASLNRQTIGVRSHPTDERGQGKTGRATADRYRWHKLIHQKLMAAMDLRRTEVESMDDEQLTEAISGLITTIIAKMDRDLPPGLDRARLAREVLNEAVGLGPLEDLLADDSISEIMVNRYNDIYVERHGKLHKTDVTFSSDDAVLSVIDRIVSPLGRRIDESSPMVDGRLKDGSRVNAVIPPLALKGPCLTIRKFARKKLTAEDMLRYGSISPAMVTFLQTIVKTRKNVVISGGTGSGKTTFLNVLSGFIPHSERIITVEDSAELKLEQPHVVSLEARPPNMEGKGEIVIRDLVRNCLRMRPDRIVVGECRGGEALDMLQAMNTGHDGSLTTVHANSPRDLISRLEVMVMMAGMELPEKAIREQIASAVHIIVQQARFSDGTRKITHITEITGMESGVVQMQHIFLYKQRGLDAEGRVVGDFVATGRVPEFYEELRQRGIAVDMDIFAQTS